MPNAYISSIKLPSGSTYLIKDQEARDLIDEMANYASFEGITTTALVDGEDKKPIVIGGSSKTPKKGWIVIYQKKEFIYNGSIWTEFGSVSDLSTLGALAYKDSAKGSVTPAGTVTQPTFTGTAVSYTPAGDVTINAITPRGNVSAPDITVTPATTTVNSITNVGTLPELTTTVANETLTISFEQGTLPTKGSNTTVMTGATAEATAPTFTGINVTPTGTFTGTADTITPVGTISQPTFVGTATNVSVS